MTNCLGRREGSDEEQVEESWKVIKTSITESTEKKSKKWLMIIVKKQSGT